MIISVKSLAKIGAIINFTRHMVTINYVELLMRPHDKFMDTNALNKKFQELLEPIMLREVTNCTVEVLDAKDEKADLALIIA